MIALLTITASLTGVDLAAMPRSPEAQSPMVADHTEAATPTSDDPLIRPMAVERAKEWLAQLPPEKIFGKSYLVGFGGLSVVLIDTGAGLVLVDGALPQAAPMILENVRKLGFNPKDIKYILSTEPHFDHAGGLAALARDTGATVLASAPGAAGLQAGTLAKDDPQLEYGGSWPRVAQVRVVEEAEVIRLGHTAITAHATPGHTMGSMSWSWRECEEDICKTIVFASSLNPVAAASYRYSAPTSAAIVRGFKMSYDRMDALPCEILIAAHPDNAGEERYNDKPGACRTYAERSRTLLGKRLARERAESNK